MGGQVYIFDLDGTLIDSMPTWVGIVLSFLEKRKIKNNTKIDKIAPLVSIQTSLKAQYLPGTKY